MCDEVTAIEEDKALARMGLSRRQFAMAGTAAVLASCAKTSESAESDAALSEQTVHIQTPDGKADAYFLHPATGTHPAVILWPDIAGLRDAFKIMARRLASAGYAVLIVNQYYRSSPAPILQNFAEWRTETGQAKLKPMITQITPAATRSDAAAFVAWLDQQKAVDTRRGIGTSGYCMGGPFTVRTAAVAPQRVKAAASFHGGKLVTAEPDSPHLLLKDTQASYLFAIGQNDDAKEPTVKDALKKAAEEARRPAEIEVYPADHGWTVLDTPIYDKAQAERAWERMLALFAKL